MRFALLAATLLCLSAASLAGCLEDGAADLQTAMEARKVADGPAEEWADDAVLVGAFGLEAGPEAREEIAGMLDESPGRPRDEGMDADERAILAAVGGASDDVPGDGKAPVWVFTYSSGDHDSGLIVAVGGAGVLSTTEGNGDGFDLLGLGQAISDWRVDSDEGAQVARGEDGFERAAADPKAMAFTMLVQGEDSPVWLFGVEASGRDGGEVLVGVDAATGEVVDAEELLQALFGLALREFGSFSGTIAAHALSTFGGGFDVELDGHSVLVVLLTLSPGPVLPMEITVTAPDGTEHLGTLDPAVGLDASHAIVIGDVPGGTYEVVVSTQVAAGHQWEVSWCTDGVAVLPMAVEACTFLPESTARGPSASETLSPFGRWPWA